MWSQGNGRVFQMVELCHVSLPFCRQPKVQLNTTKEFKIADDQQNDIKNQFYNLGDDRYINVTIDC